MPEQNTPDPVDPNVDPSGKDAPIERKVSYETHQKLLDEKKKTQAKLDAFEAEKIAREQRELEEKGEYKKLIEQKDKELNEKTSKLTQMQQRETDRLKLSKLLDAIPGTVDPKFYKFIHHIDDIVVNPETGEVDEMSVTRAAEKLRNEYPEWIQSKRAGLPNNAPGGGPLSISREEWKKLPSKEMLKWRPDQISD